MEKCLILGNISNFRKKCHIFQKQILDFENFWKNLEFLDTLLIFEKYRICGQILDLFEKCQMLRKNLDLKTTYFWKEGTKLHI